MFTELTRELVDLTATGHGDRIGLFAMVLDCCSCCCCGCIVHCG
jgi:hypothetical protein